MPFIPDASVSLCWFLPNQATYSSVELLSQAKRSGIVVPAHWHLEVVNKLGIYLRVGKLTPDRLRENLGILTSLAVDTRPSPVDPDSFLALMDRYRLTAYDAVYLQLAMSTGLSLATYDEALIAAAPQAGVPLLF